MSAFISLIRSRLIDIATEAATAADALVDAGALDLDSHTLADVLLELDGVAARVGGIVERFSDAMDPAKIAGCVETWRACKTSPPSSRSEIVICRAC
jgi:hypothetical protein